MCEVWVFRTDSLVTFRKNKIPSVTKQKIRGSVSNPCEGRLENELKRKSTESRGSRSRLIIWDVEKINPGAEGKGKSMRRQWKSKNQPLSSRMRQIRCFDLKVHQNHL